MTQSLQGAYTVRFEAPLHNTEREESGNQIKIYLFTLNFRDIFISRFLDSNILRHFIFVILSILKNSSHIIFEIS